MIGRSDLPQPPSPPSGAQQPSQRAIRAAIRTVAIFGALLLAVWVGYAVDEWWLALVLVGTIFGISAWFVVRRR
jgi:hypothetical protein